MTWTLAQVGSLFTVPGLAVAGTVAVTIPVAIHLLSRFRRNREHWGAMRFVWEAYRRHKRRLQMEQWLLLAVRCLMVAVLGLALAGPVLTGCSDQLRALGMLPGQARIVHVVIDDSLSTRAVTNHHQRFEILRATARSVLQAATPSDQVMVWPVSGRSSSAFSSLADDRAGALNTVDQLQAGYTGHGMGAAIERLAAADPADRQQVVVLISDWNASAIDPQRVPPALADADVLVVRPMASASNVQVMSVTPRQQVVVADDRGGASMPIQVALRRFGGSAAVDGGTLHIELLDSAGRELVAAQRRLGFEEGQRLMTVSEALRLSPEQVAQMGDRQSLVVRAALEPATGAGDALMEDNARYGAIELRPRLRVGIMGDAAGAGDSRSAERMTPRRWLSLVLSPRMTGQAGPIETASITAADLNGDAQGLSGFDVVMVTRPDELSGAAWTNLAQFTESGGLAWLMPPAEASSAMWVRSLRDAFDLDWQVAIEPATLGVDGEGVGVVLTDVPPALSMLGADWEALLRPVQVRRWLPMWVPRGAAWVRLDVGESGAQRPSETASTPALMALHEHGAGALLVMSAALDVEWTNLPTKPLFVPLVHEAMRSVLRPTMPSGVLVEAFAARGDETWTRLALPSRDSDQDARTNAEITQPGVYHDGEGRLQPVNVNADAGDTRAVEESALAAWLDGLGRWRFVDEADPGAALDQVAEGTASLGWPLLWVVLALVLLETVLARTLSHARADHGGLTGWVLQRLRRFHLPHHDDQRRAA